MLLTLFTWSVTKPFETSFVLQRLYSRTKDIQKDEKWAIYTNERQVYALLLTKDFSTESEAIAVATQLKGEIYQNSERATFCTASALKLGTVQYKGFIGNGKTLENLLDLLFSLHLELLRLNLTSTSLSCLIPPPKHTLKLLPFTQWSTIPLQVRNQLAEWRYLSRV